MQIMTSYFYQIRFMKPYMIPLSTAVWDPKWFHANKGHQYQYVDKNGVWNGLRAEPFVPGPACEGLCYGPETCLNKDPAACPFLKTYRKQLDKLNISDILNRCSSLGKQVQEVSLFEEEPVIIFIVHEATSNPCSERVVIQEWFRDNGINITEFHR